MSTVLDIVTRAFRKIRVASHDEPLEADFAASGLDALNDMMHEWALRGVNLEHTDLELTDEFPLLPRFREGTVYLLAGRISPDYARPREFDADDFFRAIQAAYLVIEDVDLGAGLNDLPSQKRVGFYAG